jgi:hypothetical protein
LDDFHAVVAFAALTRGKPQSGSMTPPADLDRLRTLSERLIGRYLGDDGEANYTPGDPDSQQHSVALQYVEAVLRQGEVIQRLKGLGDDAPLHTALPEPDRKRTDEFLLYRNLRGTFETLDSLIAAWQRLGAALKDRPESLLYEEYDDWLTKRDSLEDVLSLLSPATRDDLEANVRRLDERFLEATRPVRTSIKHRSPWAPQRWWWYRVPNGLESWSGRVPPGTPGVSRCRRA